MISALTISSLRRQASTLTGARTRDALSYSRIVSAI
jgi:hypothetical protein